MSDTLLLGIGTLVFMVTMWATLAVGYARFGGWYDRDQATVFRFGRSRDEKDAPSDVPLENQGLVDLADNPSHRVEALATTE